MLWAVSHVARELHEDVRNLGVVAAQNFSVDDAARRVVVDARNERRRRYRHRRDELIGEWIDGERVLRVLRETLVEAHVEQSSLVHQRRAGNHDRGVRIARLVLARIGPLPGPTGFQRHNNSGQYIADGRLTFIKYLSGEQRVVVNSSWGPVLSGK